MKTEEKKYMILKKLYKMIISKSGVFESLKLPLKDIKKNTKTELSFFEYMASEGLIELPELEFIVLTEKGVKKLEDMLIQKLELTSDKPEAEIPIDEILEVYKDVHEHGKPIWKLSDHIQRQAMYYTNVVEQLKQGKSAASIRATYVSLELLPGTSLPNPFGQKQLRWALNKIDSFRRALIDIVKKYGKELMIEISLDLDCPVSIGVNMGFPPSLTISTEINAKVKSK